MPWLYRLLGAVCALALVADARKFYNDDPLLREPAPVAVQDAKPRKLSDIYDLFLHFFGDPGEDQRPERAIPAQDVNTLGEVLDGSWYEKRHGKLRMSLAALIQGPDSGNEPAAGPWSILAAKNEGVTPGFLIQDTTNRRYFLKFDPLNHSEMATAADVISSKFFYALGYHVPENYLVFFDRSRLQLREGTTFRDAHGRKRDLTARDVSEILAKVPQDAEGRIRATASLLIPGKLLGPYRYFGTRADDPNDIVPHEHRRSLRGLHVFCAWLGHDDSRAINTLDTLVKLDGVPQVWHYLIDFGSTLGSGSTRANSPRSGFEQLFTWSSSAKELLTLGLYVPRWSTVRYPELRSVGRFSAQHFDPVRWTPEYPNPAFDNRLPEDTFWAAEQVMAFTDDEIRAIVAAGRYSDGAAQEHVATTIIRRRDAVGRAYLSRPLSLSGIRLEGDRVAFDDLAVRYGYVKEAPEYTFRWFLFDNETERRTLLPSGATASIPASAEPYLALDVTLPGNQSRRITIYLKQAGGARQIVGIERAFQDS